MVKGGISINQTDLNKLTKKFEDLGDYSNSLNKEMSATVQKMEQKAVTRFRSKWGQPTGTGAGSISSGRQGINQFYIEANAKYMAFLEWGTIRKFRTSNLRFLKALGIPESYAAQFKGKGIKKNGGIMARPFFLNSINEEYRRLLKRLENRLKTIVKK